MRLMQPRWAGPASSRLMMPVVMMMMMMMMMMMLDVRPQAVPEMQRDQY